MTQASSHPGTLPASSATARVAGVSGQDIAGARPVATTVARYVDWGAILAGAVFAAALSFILFSFGSTLGLSMASPHEGEGVSASWLAIAAGIWLVWTVVTSLGAGAYLAGRMRHRANDAKADEVETRDGTHGLMVWASSVLAAMILTAVGVGGMAAVGGAAVGSAVETASDMGAEEVDYYADLLLRGEAGLTAGATAGAATDPAILSRIAAVLRHSVLSGEFLERDKAYLAELIAQQTGTDQTEGRQKVDSAIAELDAAKAAAAEAVNRGRIVGVITGFLVAASLLLGAAVAFFAATLGGRHRDDGLFFGSRIAVR